MEQTSQTTSYEIDPNLPYVVYRRATKRIGQFNPDEEISLVPYLDVMLNLIIFMLVTIAALLPIGILSIYPPTASKSSSSEDMLPQDPLTLTVFITHKGFTVAGTGGILPSIPILPDGKYDYDQLTNKMVEVKIAFPNSRRIIITADRDIRYEILVKTMDAVRNKGEQLLFDDVKLSAGVAGVAAQ